LTNIIYFRDKLLYLHKLDTKFKIKKKDSLETKLMICSLFE